MEYIVSEFRISEYDGERPIIIYGAGVFGEYTLRALQSHGVEPLFFCDRLKAGKEYLGKKVYDYTAIGQTKHAIVLLAVGTRLTEVYQFLLQKGISEIYGVYELIFKESTLPLDILSLQARDIVYYEQLYLFSKNAANGSGGLRVYSIDWVLTEKCSLKCRDCSNLMQYYEHPMNFNADKLVADLEKLLSFVDEIMDVRVLGGEPFMHPKIAEIMQKELDNPKIRNFSIYTNATILPDEKMVPILKNRKVKCEISDYGALAKNFHEFVGLMQREHIRHHIVQACEWYKMARLQNRGLSIEELKETFAECYCNDTVTLLDGKVYRCAFSANGRRLEAIPYVEDDVVDLYGCGDIVEKLKKLIYEKKYDIACGYCTGRNPRFGMTEVAVQIKESLSYEKCK
jgi:organic radical activating enzyme